MLSLSIKSMCRGLGETLEVVFRNFGGNAVPSINGMVHPSGFQLPPTARDVGASPYIDMLGSQIHCSVWLGG